MANLLTVTNASQYGMITDVDPWALPVNGFTRLVNSRSVADNISPYGGYKLFADLTRPPTEPQYHPDFIIPFRTPRGTAILIFDNTNDKVYYIYQFDDEPVEITGDFNFSGADTFTYATIDDTLVVCSAGRPYYVKAEWLVANAPVDTFKSIPWKTEADGSIKTWDSVAVRARVIAKHGQYLFALDVTPEGATKDVPDGVFWSNPADVDNLPSTWDYLDVTNYAGFVHLAGASGKCVAGLSMRDSFVVYREYGVHVFDYVGGKYVWKIRQVTDGKGALSPRSVVDVNGIHYVMARDDIYMFDGRTFKPLTLNRIKDIYVKSLDPNVGQHCFAIKNQFHNEIMFCIPEDGAAHPNMAFVYNYALNTWALKRFSPESEVREYTSMLTAQLARDVNSWDSPDNDKIRWDEEDEIWAGTASTPLAEDTVITLEPSSKQLHIIAGHKFRSSDIIPFLTVIERVGITTDGGIDDVTMLTKAYFRFNGEGTVVVEFGEQSYPNAPVRWRERKTIQVQDQRKVDFRSTGRLHAYRISGLSSGNWKFSGVTFEYVSAGSR